MLVLSNAPLKHGAWIEKGRRYFGEPGYNDTSLRNQIIANNES